MDAEILRCAQDDSQALRMTARRSGWQVGSRSRPLTGRLLSTCLLETSALWR